MSPTSHPHIRAYGSTRARTHTSTRRRRRAPTCSSRPHSRFVCLCAWVCLRACMRARACVHACVRMAQSHSVLDCFEGLLRRLHKALDVYVFQLSEADDKRRSHPFACNMRNLTCNLRHLTCNMQQLLAGVAPIRCSQTCSRRQRSAPAATSAPGLGPPLPHLQWDWAHPCPICTSTGLAPATSAPGPAPARSAPGLRSALPDLR
jgi:hypothetical protein